MKAYHLYEDHKGGVTIQHMIDDIQPGEGSIVFGVRDSGKGEVAVAIISHGHSTDKIYNNRKYTIDTGLGYRCKGYPIKITGYINVWNGCWEAHGEFPALTKDSVNLKAKVNAFVFK